MNKAFPFCLVVLLSGCAWKSAVLPIAENTYQVSANASPARGGISGAREMALTEANNYCASMQKKISVASMQAEQAFPANGVATVTFTCE